MKEAGVNSICWMQRILLAEALAISAILKIVAPSAGLKSAFSIPFWIQVLTSPVGHGFLIGIELLIATALLGKYWRIATALCGGLGVCMLVFVLSLEINGIDSSKCGCMGNADLPLTAHLAFISGFMLLTLSCYASREYFKVANG